MAIQWQWDAKIGEVIYKNGHTANLYKGNCLAIAINEFEDDTFSLSWFWGDETHAKNMLGISKGYDNCMTEFEITKIRLNTRKPEIVPIAVLIAKAKWPVTVEFYDGEEVKDETQK